MLPVHELIITGILFMAAAYLLGSLPFSVWVGRIFYKTDVREHGSGNAGATNTWRVLGWKAGLPVLVLDIVKGYAATWIPLIFSSLTSDPDLLLWERVLCGVFAAGGHIFPVFAGFRGGKAVACLLGVILGLVPFAASLALLVFILVFLLARIVSLGSISAAISLPVFVWFTTSHPPQLMLFTIAVALLVLVTHRKNINRLVKGEEKRLKLKGRQVPGD